YEFRSHGLAVTTLAMGGLGAEDLRRKTRLPISLGEASLIDRYARTQTLDINSIERSIKFAKGRGNDFKVIKFSLSSTEPIAGLEGIVERNRDLVIVTAAGNDGRELNEKDGVWPALFGGTALSWDDAATTFITVGAHDGERKLVKFSNWGTAVDIL